MRLKYPFIDYTFHTFKNGSKVKSINKYSRHREDIRWNITCRCGEVFTAPSKLVEKNDYLLCKDCIKKCNRQANLNNDLEGLIFDGFIVLFRSIENYVCSKGIEHALWECVCNCGKIFSCRTSAIVGKTIKSCGCYHRKRSFSQMTEKWKKVTPEGRGPLYSKRDYRVNEKHPSIGRVFRKYIYARDGKKCKICNSNDRINAHHMDGWSTSTEKRYDETNIISLCHTHHKEFHRLYGNGYNTVEQFREYLSLRYNTNLTNYLLDFDEYKRNNGSINYDD